MLAWNPVPSAAGFSGEVDGAMFCGTGSMCSAFSAHESLDTDDHFMGNLSESEGKMESSMGGAAHGQLVGYGEGRSDNHPEADALVHVQLTCGLAYYRINQLLRKSSMRCSSSIGVIGVPSRFQGLLTGADSGVASSSAGR
jgi:hypothetical protein